MVLSTALTLACLACTDDHPNLPYAAGAREISTVVHCTVDVRSANVACTEEGPAGAGGASAALLGNASVKLRSANNSYDSLSLVYGFDVTVQNLLGYSIGTPDGQTRAGIKVFFVREPYVTAYKVPGDTGTVSLINHDGTQNFTGADQPYFHYDTILAPQAITSAKRWEMRVSRTVQNFGFSVLVFTSTTAEVQVPVTAPSTTPAWFYDPAYSINCGTLLTGTCLRNVLMIDFRPSATQEERQAALDVVGGRVVGGQHGAYYATIPTPDTNYLLHLSNAVQALAKLPQVEYVAPYLTTLPVFEYAIPRDTSAGWREWQLNPDSADHQNWAFERVAAPFAWGCSTGDSTTVVAVVDNGFHTIPDLTGNSDLMEAPDAFPVTRDHGTSVAAVAAGHGNDSTGVTGMMWRARLRMYDVSHNGTGNFQDLWNNVRDARLDGARVINVSAGWEWPMDPDTVTNPAVIQANLNTVRQLYLGFRRAMDSIPGGSQPLVVFSAGNQNLDARWNAARIAADSAPANGWAVLVVGGSNQADGPFTATNTGAVVRVAAPAENVHVMRGSGVMGVRNGTSYAAPMVTGLAGLLASFDPRLSASQIRDLIIQGAVRGGRRVAGGGPPIINAHESLILAGRRPGAPLCGNRLWIANGTFFAQRDTASVTGEALFAAPTSTRSTLFYNAMHGGKKIMFFTRPTFTGREWSPSGWTTIPYSGTGPHNASYLSRAGQSHHQDTTVVLYQEAGAPRTVRYRPIVRTAAGEVALPNVITDSLYDDPGLCLARFVEVPAARHADYMDSDSPQDVASYQEWLATRGIPGNCMSVGPPSPAAETLQFLAYAPVGQQAYVFIVRRRSTTSPTGSKTCTLAESTGTFTVFYTAECIDAVTVHRSAGTAGYRVNIRDGSITPLAWSEPADEMWYPQIHENGREILVERQNTESRIRSLWVEYTPGGVASLQSPITSTGECHLQFRDLQSGTVKLSPGVCFGSTGGGGGMSAVRSPGS